MSETCFECLGKCGDVLFLGFISFALIADGFRKGYQAPVSECLS